MRRKPTASPLDSSEPPKCMSLVLIQSAYFHSKDAAASLFVTMDTLGAFLRPPYNGREELGHTLASISKKNKKPHNPDNSPFESLAESILEWDDFGIQDPLLTACLSNPCEVQWQPWIPSIARVIYGERQLEALYLQTLITRVNVALQQAIPPDEDPITLVIGPGAFESVSPDVKAERILPDWVAVQGNYDIGMEAGSFPDIKELVEHRKILAVGETKLVWHMYAEDVMPHTKACSSDFLSQLQGYCRNLCTRFGFVVSNKELIVAQFLGEQDTSPRRIEDRSLRSRTTAEQLEPGLRSDYTSSGSASLNSSFQRQEPSAGLSSPYKLPEHNYDRDDSYQLHTVSPIQRRLKRPHSETSPETSPVSRSGHGIVDRSLPGSSSHIPSTPPASAVEGLQPSPLDSGLKGSDYSKYASSVRNIDVGAMLLRSFGMPSEGECEDMSPYEALFVLIMTVRDLKLQGKSIEICKPGT
ncbi:hypothetical protein TARUN_9604 [Trichoderma arundinaceum]|uniref:Uncharacterized protein n=1 Tax=Trichoderma arundinaceum TaxID=490622 RepID=A0A395N964_TRIAR|nr:hypothetical protein TARUN_9604 [Trichoderma arundinaceum]